MYFSSLGQMQAANNGSTVIPSPNGKRAIFCVVFWGCSMPDPRDSQSGGRDLSAEIDAEARERAIEHFGPNPTPEQFRRVHDCEWDIFTYHAATGDDLDCWCGAHVSSLRPAAEGSDQ